jgi:hypothetical protein
MRKRLTIAVASLVLGITALGAVTSPAGAGDATHANIAFGVVRMDGAQENPAADPDGFGTFAFLGVRDTFCYLITAHQIEAPTMAHVHSGARGVNGGIVVALQVPTDGRAFDCITAVPNDTPNTIMVLTQAELDAIIANPAGFYANVHNAPFPAGAIRGQLR